MSSKLPESTRLAYARQLANEALTLVPGVERLAEIVLELRTDDLYRLLGFDTWEQFCKGYLGVSRWTANRLIAGPKPKSIAAGQGVAAVQDAPIVESDTLKSPAASTEAPAKQSEGGGTGTNQPPAVVDHQLAPSGPSSAGGTGKVATSAPSEPGFADPGSAPPPADPSSGGARATAPPPRRDAPTEAPPASRPAPPDSNPTGPVPSLRQEASSAFRALHDATEGVGAKWTAEEATYIENRIAREMAAWRQANKIAGKVTRPYMGDGGGTATRRAAEARIATNGNGSLTRRTVEPMFKP